MTPETLGPAIARGGLVLIDFWARWCRPCHLFSPIFAASSDAHPEHVFATVDTDQQQGLARRFGVLSLPTLVVLHDGKIVYSRAGVPRLHELEAIIADLSVAVSPPTPAPLPPAPGR
ncbi:thioredoxin reductase (NADPH)/thioredoxin 1 [Sanguibacter antarcticus]|uniref:Thioredoxin reductase (NADPH)/thioredoxin 1 n=2 Tax=Sanguibacter antarcticus TaxID=372484 RepID=A0A2A9E4V7_9MICO|nr:thioredoxin reductase (NADPH)/thioredoxin 1 [Sanguibacter antarcticus]